jgi:hypothetical protein
MELRSLDLDYVRHTVEELTDALESCPVLEVLRVHNCFFFNDEDESALRSKFPQIKTMTLESDGDFYGTDLEVDSDSEDERTDDGAHAHFEI